VEGLKDIMPESLHEPKEAIVNGLGQFPGKLGILVSYPEFEEERRVLISGMDNILGISYDWLEAKPHISIARLFLEKQPGRYRGITNLTEIVNSLPETIQLSPAQPLKD
jgi:hypothetical protein